MAWEILSISRKITVVKNMREEQFKPKDRRHDIHVYIAAASYLVELPLV